MWLIVSEVKERFILRSQEATVTRKRLYLLEASQCTKICINNAYLVQINTMDRVLWSEYNRYRYGSVHKLDYSSLS